MSSPTTRRSNGSDDAVSDRVHEARPLSLAALFVVFVFAIPWVAAPWLPQQPTTTWEVIATYVPGVWAPTFVALALIAIGGVRNLAMELRTRLSVPSGTWPFLVVALVGPFAAVMAATLLARMTGSAQPFIQRAAFPTVLLTTLTTGAVGEELGWRGFLLSRFDRRFPTPLAALLMAVLWMLWHVPIFLFADSPYASWPKVPALLTILTFGTFMGGLFYRMRGSIVPTVLAHISLNATLSAGGALLSSPVLWWTTTLVFAAASWQLLRGARSVGIPSVPGFARSLS